MFLLLSAFGLDEGMGTNQATQYTASGHTHLS